MRRKNLNNFQPQSASPLKGRSPVCQMVGVLSGEKRTRPLKPLPAQDRKGEDRPAEQKGIVSRFGYESAIERYVV